MKKKPNSTHNDDDTPMHERRGDTDHVHSIPFFQSIPIATAEQDRSHGDVSGGRGGERRTKVNVNEDLTTFNCYSHTLAIPWGRYPLSLWWLLLMLLFCFSCLFCFFRRTSPRRRPAHRFVRVWMDWKHVHRLCTYHSGTRERNSQQR